MQSFATWGNIHKNVLFFLTLFFDIVLVNGSSKHVYLTQCSIISFTDIKPIFIFISPLLPFVLPSSVCGASVLHSQLWPLPDQPAGQRASLQPRGGHLHQHQPVRAGQSGAASQGPEQDGELQGAP